MFFVLMAMCSAHQYNRKVNHSHPYKERYKMEYQTIIRLSFFLGIFVLVASWEVLAPRRKLVASKFVRWYSNISIVVINSALLHLIFPILAVGLAAVAKEKGWGIFNNIEVPVWLAIVVSVLVMDFIIYLQHAMFHFIPLLWLLHRMHHADLDIDVTTGARFHPIEIIISMLIKISVVLVIGPPVIAVIIFEVLLNLTAMFNHGNIYIPVKIDRVLRLFVVTPDMHRVHHSTTPKETNSNFGFNIPWWDRIFGTYCAQPEKGHTDMVIGLNYFRDHKELHIYKLLVQPFRGYLHKK